MNDAKRGRSDIQTTRRDAALSACTRLGIERLTLEAIVGRAVEVLGVERAERLMALARAARLSRRSEALASLSALILGSLRLGDRWWRSEHHAISLGGEWTESGVPNEVIALGRHADLAPPSPDLLTSLGSWIEDDAADAEWGRPVACVDLNDPQTLDRFTLPANAKVGDRLVLSFDPGARVWADFIEVDGVVHSSLGKWEHVAESELAWEVGIATQLDLIRWPEEQADGPSDPWLGSVDPEAAQRAHRWAAAQAGREVAGDEWLTRADVWRARSRLGLPYERSELNRAVDALVDADIAQLRDGLRQLGET